jgi:hypothetical protein
MTAGANGCETDGCERRHYAKGVCRKHYDARRVATARATPPAAYYRKVATIGWAEAADGCWDYLGYRNRDGYGSLDYHLASRIVWSHHNGPIPAGMVIRHKCDRPSCVNPAHLLIGTVRDNARDMVERRRHREQSKTHCPAGHALEGDNLQPGPADQGWRTCLPCSRDRALSQAGLVRDAARALGLTKRGYISEHGQGRDAAAAFLADLALTGALT